MYVHASQEQVCIDCRQALSKDHFPNSRWGKGKVHRCRSCQRTRNQKNPQHFSAKAIKNRDLKVKYGISLEDFHVLLNQQNRLCAICSEALADDRRTHLDHNHQTGKVRGILCHKCNLGLGHFRDNADLLSSAIRYLRREYALG